MFDFVATGFVGPLGRASDSLVLENLRSLFLVKKRGREGAGAETGAGAGAGPALQGAAGSCARSHWHAVRFGSVGQWPSNGSGMSD